MGITVDSGSTKSAITTSRFACRLGMRATNAELNEGFMEIIDWGIIACGVGVRYGKGIRFKTKDHMRHSGLYFVYLDSMGVGRRGIMANGLFANNHVRTLGSAMPPSLW